MTDDAQFIPEKKSEPVEKVAKEFGVPVVALRPSIEKLDKLADMIRKGWAEPIELSHHTPASIDIIPSPTLMVASVLFGHAVAIPYPVNAEEPQDFEAIAKRCAERARDTAPYLLRELGLLPKEGE